jgi:hypothetical protein
MATLERCGNGRFASETRIYTSAMVELGTELQMVVVLALLDQERGSIRLALRRGVNLGREGSQKESRMVANFSSSLHSNLGFLSSFSGSMRAVVPGALGGISEGVGVK